MPANRVPNYDQPVGYWKDKDGQETPVRFSQPVWTFLARIAAQFSGADVPVTPIDFAGVLSILSAQTKPYQLTAGEVQEIAAAVSTLLAPQFRVNRDSAIPTFQARPSLPGDARDLALLALTRISAAPRQPMQEIVCTQATFPTLANIPPGFIYVTDYQHRIYWDGSAAAFADGGNRFLGLFEANPGTGWHLYDGSTVAALNADGTTSNVTLPDLTSAGALAAFLEAGGTNSGPTAAVAPTISGLTDDTAIGFIPAAAAASATASTGSVDAGTGGAVTVLTALTSGGGGGGGGSLINDPHHHSLSTATVSSTGEPRKLVRRPYFRQ